nr:M20/M25/M40 family metallo-hydrolase [Ardenticatena sp.]
MVEERLFQLTSQLVAINSVNPTLARGPGERAIAEQIARQLEALGLTPEVHKFAPKRANVVAVVPGRGETPPLLLNAHIDTVGAGGMPNPFTLRQAGDRWYGRGAYDMKGSVAVMLALAEIWGRTPPPGDIYLTFVADEEDRSLGMETLIREWLPQQPPPAGAIVLEPTEEQLGIAHKGFAWLEIEVHGVAAHGSRPDEGVDAILPLGLALNELRHIQEELAQQTPHPLLGQASLHASLIEGGEAWCVYPPQARLGWERRTLPNESLDTIRTELERVLAAVLRPPSRHTALARLVFARPPHEVSREAWPVRLLRAAGVETEAGMAYWTDAALLREAGIPTVLYGPAGHGAHADDEWVSGRSLVRVYDTLQRAVAHMAEVSP